MLFRQIWHMLTKRLGRKTFRFAVESVSGIGRVLG